MRPGASKELARGTLPSVDPVVDLDKCCDEGCSKPWVCHLCAACEDHCLTEGGPEKCWEAHEAWRQGLPDPMFGEVFVSRAPKPGTVPSAPKPRWRS
jgi:hypothetical protein